MKPHAITIAILLTGFTGAAVAQSPGQALPPVVVSGEVAACTPPLDAPACGHFHRFIRANFSPREIGMLFGNRTSYPEYLTGGIDRVHDRYRLLVQEYVAASPAATPEIAGR